MHRLSGENTTHSGCELRDVVAVATYVGFPLVLAVHEYGTANEVGWQSRTPRSTSLRGLKEESRSLEHGL